MLSSLEVEQLGSIIKTRLEMSDCSDGIRCSADSHFGRGRELSADDQRQEYLGNKGEVTLTRLQLSWLNHLCPKFEGVQETFSKCTKEEAGLEKLLAGSSMWLGEWLVVKEIREGGHERPRCTL